MSQINKMWVAFGLASIAFHVYLIFSGLVPNLISRPIHMALILPWIFLYNKTFSNNLIGSFIMIIGVFCCLWISFNHEILMDQYGFIEGNFQLSISIILLLIVLEMARRSVGWPLPFVSLLAIFYGYRGIVNILNGTLGPKNKLN